MKKYLMIAITLSGSYSFAQTKTATESIKAGNDYYKQQLFARATEEYSKAIATEPDNITAKFNKANALFRQDKKVDAAVALTEIASKATEAPMRAKVYYNRGVILSQQKNLEESIEAYKTALRNDPADKDARENLQKALLELKKKKEEEKKQQEQKKKKEEQKKQPQPKMNPKEAEQRLKLLQQKEKETQQRVQKEKTKTGTSQAKDW